MVPGYIACPPERIASLPHGHFPGAMIGMRSMGWMVWGMVIIGGLLLASGCRKPSGGSNGTTDGTAVGAPSSVSDSAPVSDGDVDMKKGIALVDADVETYQQVLARHRGDVVLVDFWATWCVPCRQKLPKILHLGRTHADRGLTIVTLCMDDVSNREAAMAVLKSVDANVDNLLSKWGASTASTDQFKIDSALPYYKLYDRDGKLRYQFSGVADASAAVAPLTQLEPRVEELLSAARATSP